MPEEPLRICYLTAGAAGMFCGSCMHDNTLARALIREGVDVQLIPIYTPIRTDEEDVSVEQVFFGGINVYLQQKVPLFRLVPRLLDRFLDRPGLIRRVTSRSVNVSAAELGSLTVSMLRGMHGYQRKEVKRLADYLQHGTPPDMLVLTNILIGGCIPYLKERLQCPVIVTLQGDDIFLEELEERHREQALAELEKLIPAVDGFITHSRFYADRMSNYLRIPRDKIKVVPLGIELDDFRPLATARLNGGFTRDRDEISIGYLARLAPEKGLHNLVDAFIRLHERAGVPAVRLQIAGWLAKHREAYAEEQFERLRAAGLGDRFDYLGSVDRAGKVAFLESVDVLSVPTTYLEPKGLFLLESWASALPVVQPAHGAFPELVEETQGGRLVPPNDPDALSNALEELIHDRNVRADLGRAGYEAVCSNRNAQSMARQTLQTLLEIAKK